MSSNEVKKLTCRIPSVTPSERRKGAARAWTPALLWSRVIFGLSSIPAKDLPRCQVGGAPTSSFNGGVHRRTHRARTIAAGLSAALHGITDELRQVFTPGRSPDVFEVLADSWASSWARSHASRSWRAKRARKCACSRRRGFSVN
jgi:hypothetical protein